MLHHDLAHQARRRDAIHRKRQRIVLDHAERRGVDDDFAGGGIGGTRRHLERRSDPAAGRCDSGLAHFLRLLPEFMVFSFPAIDGAPFDGGFFIGREEDAQFVTRNDYLAPVVVKGYRPAEITQLLRYTINLT